MDDSLQELQCELANLRPRRLSPALLARIEADLAHGTFDFGPGHSAGPTGQGVSFLRRNWLDWRWAAVAALASMVALVVWLAPSGGKPGATAGLVRAKPGAGSEPLPSPASAATVPVGSYRPVGAASVLYDMKEDGVVFLGDDTPVHRVRYRYVDTYTWINPATNASLKWSVPRDEVRVIPASLR